jgi:hypothetical protein
MAKVNKWAAAGFDLKKMAALAVKFPIGARVKYVGTRGVDNHQGKIGTVLWYVDANGLVLQFEDGSSGTSTPGKVEVVSLPNISPNEVSSLLRFVADYLDKVLKPNSG